MNEKPHIWNVDDAPSPAYLVSDAIVQNNLRILAGVRERTGCRILLALKGFAMFSMFDLIKQGLDGVAASSVDEARLGFEEFGKEIHVCAPAYGAAQMPELIHYAHHVVFNSISQWQRYKPLISLSSRPVKCGIRINPEYGEVQQEVYNPCAFASRLGTTRAEFDESALDGITGLHFHALCEQGADTLQRVLAAAEEKFHDVFPSMKWVNFGGGHHITRVNYDVDLLCKMISDFQQKYGVQVYLEPGEAIALNAGVLVSTVLDLHRNKMDLAILDASVPCHMPDVIEMPYRPDILGAGKPEEHPYTYRLGGPSCLAGDVIGDYSFPRPLKRGDRLVFLDMAHYTMVKNTTFNGVRLPSICIQRADNRVDVVREFDYRDFRSRLS